MPTTTHDFVCASSSKKKGDVGNKKNNGGDLGMMPCSSGSESTPNIENDLPAHFGRFLEWFKNQKHG